MQCVQRPALERFDEGAIAIDGLVLEGGRAVHGDSLRQLRRRVGLVFQFHHLFEHLSALKNSHARPGSRVPDAARRRDHSRARVAAGAGHRASRARAAAGALRRRSQRVAIARGLAVDPPALMMDEPTASLDAPRRAELSGLLWRLATENRAILVSTHDEEFAREFATDILRLDD